MFTQNLINGGDSFDKYIIELADLYIFTQEIATGRYFKEPSPSFSTFFSMGITWGAVFEIVVFSSPETTKTSPRESKMMMKLYSRQTNIYSQSVLLETSNTYTCQTSHSRNSPTIL